MAYDMKANADRGVSFRLSERREGAGCGGAHSLALIGRQTL
jgi:hypothetical protein